MTPYKQAFVVTTENGAVSLAVVMAKTSTTGKLAAKDQASTAEMSDAWDVCAYPTHPGLNEGIHRLSINDPVRDAAAVMLDALKLCRVEMEMLRRQYEAEGKGEEWVTRQAYLIGVCDAAITKAEGRANG